MSQIALARALEPWPVSLRTLDALHLATMDFLRLQGEAVKLASYDTRLVAAARALGIPLVAL
jgi:predicted nucleic acid-binding protein